MRLLLLLMVMQQILHQGVHLRHRVFSKIHLRISLQMAIAKRKLRKNGKSYRRKLVTKFFVKCSKTTHCRGSKVDLMLLIMSPHPNHLYGSVLFDDLVNETVLDIYPARDSACKVAN